MCAIFIMPGRYGGRVYSKRKRYARVASPRAIMYKRPTNRNQQRQLASVSRKVLNLEKAQNRLIVRAQYTINWDENVSANYAIVPLTIPASWQSVFGVTENVTEAQKFFIDKVNIDWLLSPAKEPDPVDFTVFLVSARTNKVYRETQALTALQNNPAGQMDYTDAPITFMNPKRYKIWKTWRVQTSGIRTKVIGTLTPDVNYTNANHYARRYYKLPFPRKIQNTASQQSWKVISSLDIPISSSLALIAFNNNSILDVESPTFKGTALFSGHI